nr:methicillin resistance protein [Kiritimatiellia bacterium]
LAVWEAIRHAKEAGLETFDFEGSVIPPIERFFRGFGGRLTPYYTVNKGWRPLETAMKFLRRGFF